MAFLEMPASWPPETQGLVLTTAEWTARERTGLHHLSDILVALVEHKLTTEGVGSQ